MKIIFIRSGPDTLGVNRIYIDNLSKWISHYCDDVKVSDDINQAKEFDVCIFSKYSSLNDVDFVKQSYKDIKIGIIHPTDLNNNGRKKMNIADFFIVGSIEEKDYYYKYSENIFRFPQIENIVPIKKKIGSDNNKIVIGYHGNLEHLEECGTEFKDALERLDKEINIKLCVMYNLKLGKWKKNRPNINIEYFDWDFDKLREMIINVDIGVVPCVNSNPLDIHYSNSSIFIKLLRVLITSKGRQNDYSLNFKNTANAGRAFVFHQLKVPVVADFWPSNFEILSNPENGRLAHTAEGWYINLLELSKSESLRNQIAENAFNCFNQLYDKTKWTRLFYDFLSNIQNK